ncbi:MAG: NAD-dependent epimerase/dehydratase family protein [Bdellovibrionales bacterium]|nr:NAD-dependent epimerase/dehydratase family protein [Bdellovibrionales bacterium]
MSSNIHFPFNFNKNEIDEIDSLYGPILIVGGSGFIGSNLVNALSHFRSDVYSCSKNVNQSWRLSGNKQLEASHLISADITNQNEVSKLIDSIKPRTIFNLSAFGAYERQSDIDKIYEVNFRGTINLVEKLKETGFNAFVQAGSSSEYGLNCSGPKESDILRPNSHYAVSKGAASLLVQYYGQIEELPINHLRLYSIYGPWEERDRLIPTIVSSGLKKNFTRFAEKHISRDFVYIEDCLIGLIRSAAKGCVEFPGGCFNIGSGKKTTLEELALFSKQLFNLDGMPSFKTFPNRKWDLSNWYSDSLSAKEQLNWSPRTSLKDGLLKTIEWEMSAQEMIRHIPQYKNKKKISCIIACYKDNQAIPVMYQRIKEVFEVIEYDYEIIFINDSSPFDDEKEIANICSFDSKVIGINHSRNFGSQSAFLSGLELCSGDAAVLMDGDLQDPPELIKQFVEKWEDEFDVVYGERIKRDAKLYMQIMYKLFYRIFRLMADFNVPVDAGDFSLIDRKVVDHLIRLPEKDVFLRGLRAWVGFKQTGIPYVRPERMFGRSTNNFFKNIWWAKKGIFSFSSKPLDYIQKFGFLIFLASVVLSIFYLSFYFLKPDHEVKGITTLVLLTLGLGGIQLLSTSVLGDYIGKVLEEVKNRPKFIRSSIILGNKKISDQIEMNNLLDKVRNNIDV